MLINARTISSQRSGSDEHAPRYPASLPQLQCSPHGARGIGSAVAIRKRSPDAPWAGNAPAILADKRGDGVDALIERIDKAAREYPYAGEYAAWPGPNSNTFTAYVARG